MGEAKPDDGFLDHPSYTEPLEPRLTVKGGVKLDHGGGGKPDHPAAGRSS